MKRTIDITGSQFGMLTVLDHAGFDNSRTSLWKCRCECGNTRIATGSTLRKGVVFSCGCTKRMAENWHGFTGTPEHRTWLGMLSRCNCETNKRYKYYGGRGIKVCKEWENSFLAFYNHMGKRPSDNHSIDRIDVNGNYEPGNCRWATQTEQCRNMRSNVRYTAYGKTLTLPEWSEELGVLLITLRKRLQYGWPHDQVFVAKKFRGKVTRQDYFSTPD